MLDADTKRKIDSARDILVGKLPDPKSQIEQITIALIYKFMDDMDKQSEELGGKAKFFTGDFEKYSWTNIFNPRISGHELVILYSEAIQKMNQNPNIPQLFRDIFKNAFLPYRDPETLKSFLKEIDCFNYDHSEKLGDAFEYLLSVMGSQGEAGQFRTPRHIIDFMVKVLDPSKDDTVLDPACGTAGFLVSAYNHIIDKHREDSEIDLTPDERKRMIDNFEGYDISPDMVRLSLVNMYLHGFRNPKIFEYDTLTSEERWQDCFNIILANPPFMSPKGGIKPHKRFSVQAKRSEVLFVDYMHEHLTPNGKAGIVVPEGIIFQSGGAYKQLRRMLIEQSLYAVVSLPAGVFNPYSGVKTSILFLDKNLSKKTDKILFVKVSNDGFSLGAQRREIKENDLPLALEIIQDYQNAILADEKPQLEKFERQIAHLVGKKTILENTEYNLSGDRYKEDVAYSGNWDLIELGNVCDIIKGEPITKKTATQGDIPVIAGGQEAAYYHNKSNRKGPIITVSASGAYAGFVNFFNRPIFASDCTTIKSKDESKLSTRYVYFILKGKQDLIYNMQRGVGQPHVYPKDLIPFKIPIPPLEIQEQIVTELVGYQKLIDGAKNVVEHYTPSFKIDPKWEVVELGDVCEKLFAGGDAPKERSKIKTEKFTVPIYSNGIGKNSLYGYTNFSKVDEDAVTISARGTIGYPQVRKAPFVPIVRLIVAIPKKEKINLHFLKYILDTLKIYRTGNSIPQLTVPMIKNEKIPLPPLEIQREIVAKIEKELGFVDANKELINMFEEKIKEKIAEVWGE